MKIRAKTVILSILVILVLLVLGGITAIGWQVVLGPDARPVTNEKFEATEARLERGRYLVENVSHCFLCHSEHDFSTPEYPTNQAKKGAGWVMPIPELNNIASRNITPDMETGIGSWSDDEIARAIREGISKDGSALFPIMPYEDFRVYDDEDVKSIVVYLRTLQPVKNKVPTRNLPGPLEYIVKTIPKPLEAPQPSHPSATPEERGKYLTVIAGCWGCHSPTDDKGMKLTGLEFGGGGYFDDPGLKGKRVFTANITSDPSGIAHYDEARLIETLHTGQLPGRMLNHIMPFESFKGMKDDDIKDIFAYLKSVPPVKHRVSNTDAPTKCEVCGQTHGLGEFNKK